MLADKILHPFYVAWMLHDAQRKTVIVRSIPVGPSCQRAMPRIGYGSIRFHRVDLTGSFFRFVGVSCESLPLSRESGHMTNQPTRVLFICMGNICRSPAAEAVFVSLLDDRGLTDRFYVDSAGTGVGMRGRRRMRDHGRRVNDEGSNFRQLPARFTTGTGRPLIC